MVAAAPSVTPIAVGLVLGIVAFAAFLPVIVQDARRPLPPPRPAKVKPVKVSRDASPSPSPSPTVLTDGADDAYVPVPARRAAIAIGALVIVAVWTTLGARTRRSARR